MKSGLFCSVLFTSFAALASAQAQTADPLQTVFNSVSQPRLQKLLKDMTGQNPVTVGGNTFSIKDRYLPASKANFRSYWSAFYQSLNIPVTALDYKTRYHLEAQGHNLEAVLPGQSKDSIVIIVHYDSMGPHGADNPGVDDDMTGMAVQMETAQILKAYAGKLHYTVRFVAADYEEWGNLEGARQYAKYIKALSEKENFKIVYAIDDEQSGWKQGADTFDIFSCGGATDSTALGDLLQQTAARYGSLATKRDCIGDNSDHYAMWEIGVKSVVFSEHSPFSNPHFDREGGDTYDKIDQAYFFKIAQVGVTFAAQVVEILPTEIQVTGL